MVGCEIAQLNHSQVPEMDKTNRVTVVGNGFLYCTVLSLLPLVLGKNTESCGSPSNVLQATNMDLQCFRGDDPDSHPRHNIKKASKSPGQLVIGFHHFLLKSGNPAITSTTVQCTEPKGSHNKTTRSIFQNDYCHWFSATPLFCEYYLQY
jgi:hypothetical protein